jgi:hypothetical protein
LVSWSGGHSCVSCVKLEPGEFNNRSFTFCSDKYILIMYWSFVVFTSLILLF